MTSPAERLETLLQQVLATEPQEIDCDEFLERVAAFIELLEDGTAPSPPPALQAVAQHLEVCPECREEFDALLRTRKP